MEFFGIYGGIICGLIGFLTAIASLLYTRTRVAKFEASVMDLDWDAVSKLTLDVQKLKSSAQKWTNNENAMQKVSQRQMLEEAALRYQLEQQQQTPRMTVVEG
jgi:hypothetical protein|tara:strand:- start:1203 stop:1511 length:309 start_codon:yes stop_codon:yes gene_type:complete